MESDMRETDNKTVFNNYVGSKYIELVSLLLINEMAPINIQII